MQLDMVAHLTVDLTPANSTTMHIMTVIHVTAVQPFS